MTPLDGVDGPSTPAREAEIARQRVSALGGYRFWRDTGYVAGALIGGITAARPALAP